jgi:hypothetical protein
VEDDNDTIRPAEAARDRRRDRRAEAGERSGMRTGLAKQFKQVLDTQVKRATEAERELDEMRGGGITEPRTDRDRDRRRPAHNGRDAG